MSDYELVKNNYKQDGDLLLRFEYEGEVYHVEMGRYLLTIKNSRNEEYCRTKVYSYYDSLAYNSDFTKIILICIQTRFRSLYEIMN